MKIVLAFVFSAFALCAEEAAVPLEKFIRRDVPDAILDEKFRAKKFELLESQERDNEYPERRWFKMISPSGTVLIAAKVQPARDRHKIRRLSGDAVPFEFNEPREEAESRTTAMLARKLHFVFAVTSRDEAIFILKEQVGIDMVYDASVKEYERGRKLIFQSRGKSAEDVLTDFCNTVDLTWEVLGSTIVFREKNRQVQSVKEDTLHK